MIAYHDIQYIFYPRWFKFINNEIINIIIYCINIWNECIFINEPLWQY